MGRGDPRVWVSSWKRKDGKPVYSVRWYDPAGRVRGKTIGTNKREAEHRAGEMEAEMRKGEYREFKRITWPPFVTEYVGTIEGKANATEAKRTLEEFGCVIGPTTPRTVRYGDLQRFLTHLRGIENTPATCNKKLRYLRAAMNYAIECEYAAQNPVKKGLFRKERKKLIRTASKAEEAAILQAASDLFGETWRVFLYTALNTGARRGELLALTWDRVSDEHVTFTNTKSGVDRRIPVSAKLADVLRRLKIKTLVDGGPFMRLGCVERKWPKIIRESGVTPITLHDLRRTFCTRLIQAGVPLTTVQELLGHANVTTTVKYYSAVSDDDRRDGIELLGKRFG